MGTAASCTTEERCIEQRTLDPLRVYPECCIVHSQRCDGSCPTYVDGATSYRYEPAGSEKANDLGQSLAKIGSLGFAGDNYKCTCNKPEALRAAEAAVQRERRTWPQTLEEASLRAPSLDARRLEAAAVEAGHFERTSQASLRMTAPYMDKARWTAIAYRYRQSGEAPGLAEMLSDIERANGSSTPALAIWAIVGIAVLGGAWVVANASSNRRRRRLGPRAMDGARGEEYFVDDGRARQGTPPLAGVRWED